MSGSKRPTPRTTEEDLMKVATPQRPGEARCTALGPEARVLSVCKGEPQKPKAYEYTLGERGAGALTGEEGAAAGADEAGSPGDESSDGH